MDSGKIARHVDVSLGPESTAWSRYGITEAPVMLNGLDGKEHPTGRKFVLRDGLMAADVSTKYTLLPNEEVLSLLEEAGYKPDKVYYSKDGNSMHAQLLTDKIAEVKVGDVVKLGIMVHNSIDGSLGFGGDLFNMRLWCANGAVSKGENLASFSHIHVGERDKIISGLKASFERLMATSDALIATYRKAAETRLNEAFAKQLVKVLPDKYIPDYIETNEKDPLKPIISADHDLWTVYNQVTEAVWHSDRPSMTTKLNHERNLYNALVVATTRSA